MLFQNSEIYYLKISYMYIMYYDFPPLPIPLSSQVPFLLLLLICVCVVCMHVTIQGHTMHTPVEARAG